MLCNMVSIDILYTTVLFADGHLRDRHNFNVSSGETNTSTIDVLHSKRLGYRVVFETRVKHFDHIIFINTDI